VHSPKIEKRSSPPLQIRRTVTREEEIIDECMMTLLKEAFAKAIDEITSDMEADDRLEKL